MCSTSRLLKAGSVCRRVVQVHLSTSDVDIELSQYVKRELHSLHNYLLTSFTSQDIADFSKHFAKVTTSIHQSEGSSDAA
jgi:hypothetical protein